MKSKPHPTYKSHNNTVGFITLIITALLSFLFITSCSNSNIHQCNWEDCDHIGERIDPNSFKSYWGYNEYTDGWCVELTHYTNPQLTYEQCEQYVMSGVE